MDLPEYGRLIAPVVVGCGDKGLGGFSEALGVGPGVWVWYLSWENGDS